MVNQLITKSFQNTALSFPNHVDRFLASSPALKEVKQGLDQAVAMKKYAEQLRAGIELERPIAIGVLKLKARLGELIPRGQIGAGRGNKNPSPGEGFSLPKHPKVIATYRKLVDHTEKLDQYYESIEDGC